MTVTIHTPSAPLRPYINRLWYCDGPATYPRLKVLPMPSLHLMVNLGDPYQVYSNSDNAGAGQVGPFATCAESWSVGLWNTYHIMDWPHDMRLLNVSFKPGGAYPFLGLPLSELHNQIVSLDDVWGSLAAGIRERLYDAPTTRTRFEMLENLLLARLRSEEPRGLHAVRYAVGEIARNRGALSIRELSNRMGISQKHLDTLFKRLAGGTPKELARIYRFKHMLYSIDPTQPVDWTRLAYQSHYYDQSHLNKDFEAFTGHNPTAYLRLLCRIHAEHPEYGPKHLPAG